MTLLFIVQVEFDLKAFILLKIRLAQIQPLSLIHNTINRLLSAMKGIPATGSSATESSHSIAPKYLRFFVGEKCLLLHKIIAEDTFVIQTFCAEKEITSEMFFVCLFLF